MFKHDFRRQKTLKKKIFAVLFNQGVQALILYRISNVLIKKRRIGRILATMIYRLNIFLTGADIWPEATLGKKFLFPHSTGVVIGGMAVIGDDVTIMHGVTLGSRRMDLKSKRHPTIEDGVFIGANATILGNVTIGKNSRIGANVVVTEDLPENTTVFLDMSYYIRKVGE